MLETAAVSRRAVIVCALVGCAPARVGPAATSERSTSPPGDVRGDAGVGRDGEREGPAGGEAVAAVAAGEVSEELTEGGASTEQGEASSSADAVEASADDGARSSPAGDPAATAVDPPDPDPAPIVIAADEVPAFARLGFSPRSLGKQRVLIRRAGRLYAPSSLAPLTDDGDRHWMANEVRVLDGDATGSPRRPRVLCENAASRLGVAVDAEDLGTAIRTTAFVGPSPALPRRPTSSTPGLRLAGGTEIDVRGGPVDGALEIAYEGLFLVAEGFVAADAVDVVYTPGELEDDGWRNGELRRNASFLDAPGGVEIASTHKAPDVANRMFVWRLGPVEDEHVLVRYQEHEGFVVGWVRADDVEAFDAVRLRGGGGGGSGFGTDGGQRVTVNRGTRLVATGSTEVIGVVTKEHELPCVLDCDGANPRVRVWACSRGVELRAVR